MDEKTKNRVKHLRRRLRNGRTVTATDAALLRSVGAEVKESQISSVLVSGLGEHGVQGEPATGEAPRETLPESAPPPAEETTPPPLGVTTPEVSPVAHEPVPGISVALSPAAVAQIATNICKGMARYSAERGLLALPDMYWDQVFSPACEAVIRQYAPKIGDQAAAPVVVGSAAFQATQAARAYFAESKKKTLGNGAQGEPATKAPPPDETPEGTVKPRDVRDVIFGGAQ